MSRDEDHESASHKEELLRCEGLLAKAFGVDQSDVIDRLHEAGLCMTVSNEAPFRVKLVRILPSIHAEMMERREALNV